MWIIQLLACMAAVIGAGGCLFMADLSKKVFCVIPIAIWIAGASVPLVASILEDGPARNMITLVGVFGLELAGGAVGVWMFQWARLQKMKRLSLED